MEAIMTSLLSLALGTSVLGGPVHGTSPTVARAAGPLVEVQWAAPGAPAGLDGPIDPSTPAYVAEE